MRHCAETLEINLQPLYESIAWPLAKKFGHCYDAFSKAITDEDQVFEGIEMAAQVKEALMSQIKRRLSPQAVKVRSDFEVTCFSYEGIDAIKAALFAGEAAGSNKDVTVNIKLIAPPLYVMMASSMDKTVGIEALNKALDAIKMEITNRKGRLVVKQEPHAVSEKEEASLAEELKALELQNTEVDGDDDGSDDE